MLGGIRTYAALAGLVAVLVVGALFYGKHWGAQACRIAQLEQAQKDTRAVTDARTEANSKTDDQLDRELSRWSRTR